jgi:hypothetical protein
MTTEWQITDLTTGARDYHAMVMLPGGTTIDVALGTEGLDRLRIGLVQSGLDPKHFDWPPANDPDRSPYRGLLPLEADDAGIRETSGARAEKLHTLAACRTWRIIWRTGYDGAIDSPAGWA